MPRATERSAQCWRFRGIVLEGQGKVDEAIEATRRAIQLDPSDPEYQHRLGQLLLRNGQPDEAQKHLAIHEQMKQAIDLLGETFEAYRTEWARDEKLRPKIAFRFGTAFEKLSLPNEATDWYRVGLAEDPADEPCKAAVKRLQAASRGTTGP
jgi:tetratricopeptide (TPR) repeat protein